MRKVTIALRLCLSFAVLAAFTAFAASDSKTSENDSNAGTQEKPRVFNSNINVWVEGTVSKIDSQNRMLSVHGSRLPFATAHAEMRHELSQKEQNAAESKRQEIASQVRNEWKDRLEQAKKEKKSADMNDYNLKVAPANELAVLDKNDVPFFNRLRSGKGSMANSNNTGWVEIDIVEVYEIPANAAQESQKTAAQQKQEETPIATSADQKKESNETKANEPKTENKSNEMQQKLSLTDIKVGDRVMVGFNSENNEAFTVIRESEKK